MATSDKLLGTRLKLERAKKHFDDLDAVVGNYLKSNPCVLDTKRDPETRKLIYYVDEIRPIPSEIAIIAGDMLFNLRSALDHLAMQFWLDGDGTGGGSVKSVYFPIFDSATAYCDGRNGKVAGMRPEAKKAIDAIEPYQGGKGHQLWLLHALNKTDKHRLLLAVGSAFRSMNIAPLLDRLHADQGIAIQTPDVFIIPADRMLPLKAGDELFIDAPDAEFNKDMQFTIEIAFGEPEVPKGHSIIKTLGEIGQFVDITINTLAGVL
jgi:hypothetical protein